MPKQYWPLVDRAPLAGCADALSGPPVSARPSGQFDGDECQPALRRVRDHHDKAEVTKTASAVAGLRAHRLYLNSATYAQLGFIFIWNRHPAASPHVVGFEVSRGIHQ